jgi:hypothetical protein
LAGISEGSPIAASSFQFTVGSGSFQHTYSYTRGGVTGHAPYVLLGEVPDPTYDISFPTASMATAASHWQIMAGASLPVLIRRIRIKERVAPGANATVAIQLIRLTTAGTGGTVVTPRPRSTASAAAGCTAMAIPTAKGTEGVSNWEESISAVVAPLPAGPLLELVPAPNEPPWIIPAGTANGYAIKNLNGVATATFDIMVTVCEVNFVPGA